MKENVIEFLRKAGWRGVILGLVVSVMVAPILSLAVDPLFIEAGLYGDPTIEKSVVRLDEEYPQGAVVQRFGNITWKKEYDVYRVTLSHEGGPPIRNAIVEVRLPGCFEQAILRGPSAEGDFEIDTPVEPIVEVSIPEKYHDQVDSDISACTAFIQVEEMHEDELIRAPMVVSHQPEYCEMLVSFNPDPRFLLEYSWEADGQIRDERSFGQVSNADRRYDQTTDIVNNSTLIWSEEEYKAYLYGVTLNNSTQAQDECYVKPYVNESMEGD